MSVLNPGSGRTDVIGLPNDPPETIPDPYTTTPGGACCCGDGNGGPPVSTGCCRYPPLSTPNAMTAHFPSPPFPMATIPMTYRGFNGSQWAWSGDDPGGSGWGIALICMLFGDGNYHHFLRLIHIPAGGPPPDYFVDAAPSSGCCQSDDPPTPFACDVYFPGPYHVILTSP